MRLGRTMEYPKTSRTLLDHVVHGNEAAWYTFYNRYQGIVLEVAIRWGHLSQEDAEDVLQNIMSDFFSMRETFVFDSGKAKFRTFFGRIIANKVIDFQRKNSREYVPFDDGIATELSDHSRELDEVNRIIMSNWSQVLLDDLREKFNQRVSAATFQAFQLFALQERPVDKVADFLGCTVNQVYQAKKRCMSVLDDILRDFHKEDPDLPEQTLKEVFLAFMDGREDIRERVEESPTP
ncbi:MAG: RNA polymerase sigma factor [Oligosphaeraceae bacterium]